MAIRNPRGAENSAGAGGVRIRLPGRWISGKSPCVRSEQGQTAKAPKEIKEAIIAERQTGEDWFTASTLSAC